MKRIAVIARQRIIDPKTWKIHTDEGLRALNSYYEDIVIVEEPFDETTFILQFEAEHPELRGWNFQLCKI